MTRPLLLDLFCGAGGAAMGYHRAGFEVVGVDSSAKVGKHYPFEFHCGDALEYLAEHGHEFDVIHASPPCQAHSDLQKQSKRYYRDLIVPVRTLLCLSGKPYIIENVEGAPLVDPVMLCGAMFSCLRIYRHRLFESTLTIVAPPHRSHRELTFTHDKRKAHYGRPLDLATMRVQVTGGGNAPVWAKAEAMGIDWMSGSELNEAIPPVYTEFIGAQLIEHLEAVAS